MIDHPDILRIATTEDARSHTDPTVMLRGPIVTMLLQRIVVLAMVIIPTDLDILALHQSHISTITQEYILFQATSSLMRL